MMHLSNRRDYCYLNHSCSFVLSFSGVPVQIVCQILLSCESTEYLASSNGKPGTLSKLATGPGLRADEGDREGRKLSMHSCNHIYDSVVLDDISQSSRFQFKHHPYNLKI